MALSFNGRTDIQWPMATGIRQGSPASPILFLLYLHRLFDSLQLHHPNIWSPSYIDDVALVAQGKTREENSRALEAAARTTFQWAWEGVWISLLEPTAMATPPPAFATTSTETIDFSIGFGFAALIYVSL
jgi:hypothetical protein